MATQYLLDTNIVSFLLKGQFPNVRTHFEKATVDAISISAITESEVLYGLERISSGPRQRFAAESFFNSVTRLAWDSAAARSYSILRTRQERKGRPLSVEDMMIAAHGIASELVLVTHDRAFSFVDGLLTED